MQVHTPVLARMAHTVCCLCVSVLVALSVEEKETWKGTGGQPPLSPACAASGSCGIRVICYLVIITTGLNVSRFCQQETVPIATTFLISNFSLC